MMCHFSQIQSIFCQDVAEMQQNTTWQFVSFHCSSRSCEITWNIEYWLLLGINSDYFVFPRGYRPIRAGLTNPSGDRGGVSLWATAHLFLAVFKMNFGESELHIRRSHGFELYCILLLNNYVLYLHAIIHFKKLLIQCYVVSVVSRLEVWWEGGVCQHLWL